jgi:hypothetical protein
VVGQIRSAFGGGLRYVRHRGGCQQVAGPAGLQDTPADTVGMDAHCGDQAESGDPAVVSHSLGKESLASAVEWEGPASLWGMLAVGAAGSVGAGATEECGPGDGQSDRAWRAGDTHS